MNGEWKREDRSQKKRRGREEGKAKICKGRAKWNLHYFNHTDMHQSMTMICDSSVYKSKTSLQLLHKTVMLQSRVEIKHYFIAYMCYSASNVITHDGIMSTFCTELSRQSDQQ